MLAVFFTVGQPAGSDLGNFLTIFDFLYENLLYSVCKS